MLASLHIENIALIRRLDLELAEGFCAFTGETGAGKSILIDAIGLLCGARGERDLIRSGEDCALVEGMFSVADRETIEALEALDVQPDEDGLLFLQRKLQSDGRSSAKLNGRAVPLSKLRECATLLLNLHGQQDTQTLSTPDRQRELLDAYAGDQALLDAYTARYTTCLRLRQEREQLRRQAEELAERRDLLLYQVQELEQAKPRIGEEEELLAEHALLANREKVTEGAYAAYDALYGADQSAAAQTAAAIAAVSRLRSILPEGDALLERLENAKAELTDLAETLQPYTADQEDASARLQQLETRLDQLSALRRKYRTDEAGLIAKWEQAKQDLEKLDNSKADSEELTARLRKAEEDLATDAEALHAARAAAAASLSERVQTALAELDMPRVRFVIELQPQACGPNGKDGISFAVSANAGEEPRPIAKIASGGELSRIMLCLQCVLADTEHISTLIFDEIDTGISGKTNEKIGRMMRRISSVGHTQVICVTHAAQLAACAEHHFYISKQEHDGRTQTKVEKLDRDGRVNELARIMGGLQLTDAVRLAANELLRGGEAP